MNRSRHIFTVGGSALVLAAVLLGGIAFSPGRADVTAFATGYTSPSPDPCDVLSNTGADLSIAQAPCETATEETPPKTHTPTPRATGTPTTDVPNTRAPSNTPPPPPSTSTPTGGAAGGGVRPPATGGSGDGAGGSTQWLLVLGGLIAATAGIGSLSYGVRRK